MNRPITAILLSLVGVAVCQPAQGLLVTFDISGHEIFGEFDYEFPSYSTDFGVPGTVTEVAIDATGESFGESPNLEIEFWIDTDFQFDGIFGDELGLADSPGPFSIVTTVPFSVVSTTGEVYLTLSEWIDDGESPDSAFGPNSSVTIAFEPYIPVAPPEATELGLLAAADMPFSIDTFGSSFDTELGLYNAEGIIVDFNDDSTQTPGVHSELDLANGLPSGDYYLAIGGLDTEFGPLGFSALALSGSVGGDFVLNFPTGSTSGLLAPESVQFFRFAIGVSEPSADFDGDGDVDGDDFLAWQTGFGISGGASRMDGDADADGDVDGDDFLIWQTQFAPGGGSATAAVPEPATVLLLLSVAVVGTFLRLRGN